MLFFVINWLYFAKEKDEIHQIYPVPFHEKVWYTDNSLR